MGFRLWMLRPRIHVPLLKTSARPSNLKCYLLRVAAGCSGFKLWLTDYIYWWIKCIFRGYVSAILEHSLSRRIHLHLKQLIAFIVLFCLVAIYNNTNGRYFSQWLLRQYLNAMWRDIFQLNPAKFHPLLYMFSLKCFGACSKWVWPKGTF